MLSSRLVDARPVRTVASLWRKSSITFSILLFVSLLTSLTIVVLQCRLSDGSRGSVHFPFSILSLSFVIARTLRGSGSDKWKTQDEQYDAFDGASAGALPAMTNGIRKMENGKYL